MSQFHLDKFENRLFFRIGIIAQHGNYKAIFNHRLNTIKAA